MLYIQKLQHLQKIAHCDCSLMDSNKIYPLNKVAAGKIEPQINETSKVKGQIFNRFFRGKLDKN